MYCDIIILKIKKETQCESGLEVKPVVRLGGREEKINSAEAAPLMLVNINTTREQTKRASWGSERGIGKEAGKARENQKEVAEEEKWEGGLRNEQETRQKMKAEGGKKKKAADKRKGRRREGEERKEDEEKCKKGGFSPASLGLGSLGIQQQQQRPRVMP